MERNRTGNYYPQRGNSERRSKFAVKARGRDHGLPLGKGLCQGFIIPQSVEKRKLDPKVILSVK